jgi:hypothetical protein
MVYAEWLLQAIARHQFQLKFGGARKDAEGRKEEGGHWRKEVEGRREDAGGRRSDARGRTLERGRRSEEVEGQREDAGEMREEEGGRRTPERGAQRADARGRRARSSPLPSVVAEVSPVERVNDQRPIAITRGGVGRLVSCQFRTLGGRKRAWPEKEFGSSSTEFGPNSGSKFQATPNARIRI